MSFPGEMATKREGSDSLASKQVKLSMVMRVPMASSSLCTTWDRPSTYTHTDYAILRLHNKSVAGVIITVVIHASRKDQVPGRYAQVHSAVSKQGYQRQFCTTNLQLSVHLGHCRLSCSKCP